MIKSQSLTLTKATFEFLGSEAPAFVYASRKYSHYRPQIKIVDVLAMSVTLSRIC